MAIVFTILIVLKYSAKQLNFFFAKNPLFSLSKEKEEL
jgi:hypothetical protein